MILGLLAAVASSAGYGLATLLQARGTRAARGRTGLAHPLVALGLALDGACFLLSLVAYARVPLFLVQAVLAAALVVTVLLAPRMLGVAARRADLAAAGVVVLALVVLAGAAGDAPPRTPPAGFTAALLVGTLVLGAGVAIALRRGPAWLLALLAALGYSGIAVAARGARGGEDLVTVVAQPLTAVILGCGLVAVLAYLGALRRGSAGLAAAVVAVVEVLVPGALGVAVLGDGVRGGWTVAAVLGVTAAVAGCLVLAGSPATAAAEAATPE